ncbi:TPA: hypothetical protein ACGR2T_002960 [Escherichia coli]|nr:hypothetical protein [Escherichia coli]
MLRKRARRLDYKIMR